MLILDKNENNSVKDNDVNNANERKALFSELENKIMDLINKKGKNLTFKQIKRGVGVKSEEDLDLLNSALKSLEVKGYLYLNDYDEYQIFPKNGDIAVGEVRYKGKKAYVVTSNNVFINDSHLNGAIAGDIVVVKRNNPTAGQNSRGVVKKILKRTNGKLIFDYIDGKLIPYNWPVLLDIKLPKEKMEHLVDGERISVSISLDKEDDKYLADIDCVIGHKDDPKFDIKTMAVEKGVSIEFSEEDLKQAGEIPTKITKEMIQKRLAMPYGVDFRENNTFTIDCASAKDLDDAVDIKKLPNGNYLLGVHIADVSYFIKENTALDVEAKNRATSHYLYQYVIPMFPHSLSNGICSLNPNEDRFTLSCIMEINPEGEVVDFQIADGIINSKKKMTYEEINDIFENNNMHEDYEPYLYDLSLMVELSEILNLRKRKRGYLSFGDNDVNFIDDNG